MDDRSEKAFWYDELIDALKEERRKIQVFRRELPLCFHLINQSNIVTLLLEFFSSSVSFDSSAWPTQFDLTFLGSIVAAMVRQANSVPSSFSSWMLLNVGRMVAAAKPKHIRELMKVDGLTNDEVKSHLQVSGSCSLL
ncbi:hypothetical protein BHE74_00043643 [Ensete ventricosum]|nr:hypothetical protein GW17_00049103 [Ensete ventricosum]RWW50121.1 hypothetical protein BHE74_00043643 [Ensete ventricosum]RZR91844.1 hypothetical protein BHM03_00020033 [Ensete ventricosum]